MIAYKFVYFYSRGSISMCEYGTTYSVMTRAYYGTTIFLRPNFLESNGTVIDWYLFTIGWF